MSNFSLDRDSFQKLLANAYAVQQSQMDSRSLSAIVELQRLVAQGDLDVDGSLHLIAHHTQDVANATGVAIGLLKGNQLVYRAGCGSAATYVGRSMPASLVVPANGKANSEILRVENTETDARIESAICRQFGSKSLLILLICRNHEAAGVLEIFFSEAHPFEERELRTYRLLAGLAGEAISLAAPHGQDRYETAGLPAISCGLDRTASERCWDLAYTVYQRHIPGTAGAARESLIRYADLAWTITRRRAALVSADKRRSLAMGAVALIMLAGLITFSHRRAGSVVESSAQPTVSVQPSLVLPAKASTANVAPNPKTASDQRVPVARRVRVSDNEIDYIKDDVTVRYFTPQAAPHRVHAGNSEVAYIGDDVTVRYFKGKPAVAENAKELANPWSMPANSAAAKITK